KAQQINPKPSEGNFSATSIAITKVPNVNNERIFANRCVRAEISSTGAAASACHSNGKYARFPSTKPARKKQTGTAANCVSATHAVENGTSDTMNRCAKFIQM